MQGWRHWSTAALAVVALALVAFVLWCARFVADVDSLREEVRHRVEWLAAVEDARNVVARSSTADELLEQARDLDRVADELHASERSTDRSRMRVVAAGAAVEQLAASVDGTSAPPGARERAEEALSLAAPAIRGETAAISAELGDRWNAIPLLAGGALLLAVVTIASLVYARFVVVTRGRQRVHSLNQQLVQADRLAAVGTLAAGVAHEINNPMTYVMTNLDALQSRLTADGTADPEVERLLSDAVGGAERVTRIVRDLRIFAHPHEERAKPVDVHAVLEASLNIAASDLRRAAEVVRDYGSIPPVRGTETGLGQVFLNLVINAIHAMGTDAPTHNQLTVRTRAEGGDVVVQIVDTGPGVPRSLRERVFEPFVTDKPVGKGTGLGLFVCRGIVEAFGGTIGLDSSARGTTVTVRLRRALGSARSDPTKEELEARSGARILVVDDEELVATALARLLRQYEVKVCSSGEAALRTLADESFDLVLCDLMMPGMDGRQLFDQVARTLPEVARQFVFMTGGTFSAEMREFVVESGQPCLEKPFSAVALLRVIAERIEPRQPAASAEADAAEPVRPSGSDGGISSA